MSFWKKIANYKGKAKKEAAEASEKIEDEGLGEFLKGTVTEGGRAIGKGIGHAVKTLDGVIIEVKNDLGQKGTKRTLREVYDQGRINPNHVAEYGGSVADAVRDWGVGIVTGGLGALKTVFRPAIERIADYEVTDEDRGFSIGSVSYTLAGDSKTQIAQVQSYMTDTAGRMRSNAPGRRQVLNYIAANVITDDVGLVVGWEVDHVESVQALNQIVASDVRRYVGEVAEIIPESMDGRRDVLAYIVENKITGQDSLSRKWAVAGMELEAMDYLLKYRDDADGRN